MGKPLDPPPIATDIESSEVLRVWAIANAPHQLTINTTWKDPGAWGLLLVDIARHASLAYEADGRMDASAALARIRSLFDAEWDAPTDERKNIT